MLHGSFTSNVSTTKAVGPVKVVVRFGVTHSFDSESGTGSLRVVPIAFEPHWLPNVLQPISCEAVPFTLGDACNVTMDDTCIRAGFAKDMISALSLLWDPTLDTLAAAETVSTGFFTETFEWTERRVV